MDTNTKRNRYTESEHLADTIDAYWTDLPILHSATEVYGRSLKFNPACPGCIAARSGIVTDTPTNRHDKPEF